MRNTARLLVGLMALLPVLLSACSSKQESNEPVTLTVAGVIPDLFKMEFGETFVINGQEINLKFVPYEEIRMDAEGKVQYEQIYSQFSPDLVYFASLASLKDLIDGGKLMPLDSFAKDSEELNSIAPNVMKKIRGVGEGQLYAWPGAFSTEALFYNKELLDRYHVPYPAEASSWRDVMQSTTQLATAKPINQDEIYPFLDPGKNEPEEKLFWLIYNGGLSEGLQLIHPQTMEISADSSSWKGLWESFIEAYRQEGISNEDYAQEGKIKLEQGLTYEAKYKLFLDRKAAFVVADPSLIYLLSGNDNSWWGIAQQPGSRQIYTQISEMYGINPESAHTAEAWKLISYLTSDEIIKSKAGGGGTGSNPSYLPARVSVLEQVLSLDLSPFYKQEPASFGVYDPSPIPGDLFVSMKEQMMERISDVLSGEQTVDQALVQLQGSLEASIRTYSK